MESVFRRSVGERVLRGIGILLLLLSAWPSGPAAAGANRQMLSEARESYRALARAEALRQGVPFPLVDAVMRVESGYDPRALGASGEIGLMQLMPGTAALLGFTGTLSELAEPAANIAIGTRYLAQAWRLARKDICTTVMKYRAGHGEERFSRRSIDYCARVRAHLRAGGIEAAGAGETGRPNLEVAGFSGLADFGSWVAHRNNHVWIPRNIEAGWRPYTVGRWAFTRRYGWMWVSDEPFGWATYHHGRWGHASELGWYWVPDRHWAPAWVSWRRSARKIAWAPLPPSGDGAEVSANIDCCIIPFSRWTAVPVGNFLDRDLAHVVVHDAIRDAQPVGTVTVENRVVVNRALSVSAIEQQTGRRVPAHDVRQTDDPLEVTAGLGDRLVVLRLK